MMRATTLKTILLLREDNSPLVQVKINNSVSATFLFDTGANTSFVSDKVAAKLNLKSLPTKLQGKAYSFEGKPIDATVLDSVVLGGFTFKRFLFLILPEKRIALGDKHIDGIVDVDFIKYYEYLFDPSKHRITMFAPARLVTPPDGAPKKYVAEGLVPEEIKALGFSDAKSFSITDSDKDGKKYVHALCNNNGKHGEEDLIFDTGASASTISPALASQLDLKPFSENVPSYGLPGIEYLSTATLDKFQVGDLVLQNQQIIYSSQRAYDKNLPSVLGMNILSKYDVLMDFTNNKVYLKSLASGNAPVTITVKPAPAAPTPAPAK